MKTTLLVILASGLFGIIWSCGGATEPPVNEPEPPTVDVPDPAAEPDPEPADETATEEPNAAEEPAATEEKPAEEAAATEEKPAEEKTAEAAADSGFQGKGMKTSVIGTDKGKKGTTNFDHWKHQELGVKCIKCHHKGAGRKSCNKGSDCHKFTEQNAPTTKDAFHKSCNPCHKKKGLSKGCDYCHTAKAS